MAGRELVLVIIAVTLLAAACGSREGSDQAPPESATASSSSQQLTDLRDITQLRSLFNSRSGEPRLILLVSPT
jgi:hypothetical protein